DIAMATRFAAAKATHRISTALRRSKPVTDISHRLDRRLGPELAAQATDRDVDDVRARVEVVAPDLGQQALAADHLASVLRQMMEQPELAVGELARLRADASFAAGVVDHERAHAEDIAVATRVPSADVHSHARQQLVERERLGQVVVRT